MTAESLDVHLIFLLVGLSFPLAFCRTAVSFILLPLERRFILPASGAMYIFVIGLSTDTVQTAFLLLPSVDATVTFTLPAAFPVAVIRTLLPILSAVASSGLFTDTSQSVPPSAVTGRIVEVEAPYLFVTRKTDAVFAIFSFVTAEAAGITLTVAVPYTPEPSFASAFTV